MPSKFEDIAAEVGKVVTTKNTAYGDSFSRTHVVLYQLYPHGIQFDQYQDVLFIARVLDKLFRIATNPDYANEDPFQDIAGYAILAIEQRRGKK